MAKDSAVFSIEVNCLQRLESDDSFPGDHNLVQVEAGTRRLSVHTGAPWGIDRIDTNGEPAVRSWRQPQLWLLAHSSAQRASAAQDGARIASPRAVSPSLLAFPTGGPANGEYDDGDLTGKDVRVYVVDTGVQGSHVDFGGRVVNGHTVRAAPVGSEVELTLTLL